MFEGFETHRVTTSETEIHLRAGGDGPPVLLIHGYPQTHVCWHAVATRLAERFRVVAPDLRGYGDSAAPASDPGHEAYSKRTMANDLVEAMAALGHARFAVVGHDRGARVAYRMTLDHAERVERLASLDVVPTLDMWESIDKARAIGGFHWAFLAQAAPFPEILIGHAPELFQDTLMANWAAPGFRFDAAATEAYHAAFRNPDMSRATCEDYRAGATVDAEHDAEDRAAGRRIGCPVLFLWGGVRGFGGPQGGADPLGVWRAWADDVEGGALDCGHFLPEEAPEQVVERLQAFLGGVPA